MLKNKEKGVNLFEDARQSISIETNQSEHKLVIYRYVYIDVKKNIGK